MNVLSNRVCDMFQSFSWQLSSICDRLDHRIDDFRLWNNCSAFGRRYLVCCSFEFGAFADSLQPKMAGSFESTGHLALFLCMSSSWMTSTSLLRINRKSLLQFGWSDFNEELHFYLVVAVVRVSDVFLILTDELSPFSEFSFILYNKMRSNHIKPDLIFDYHFWSSKVKLVFVVIFLFLFVQSDIMMINNLNVLKKNIWE